MCEINGQKTNKKKKANPVAYAHVCTVHRRKKLTRWLGTYLHTQTVTFLARERTNGACNYNLLTYAVRAVRVGDARECSRAEWPHH